MGTFGRNNGDIYDYFTGTKNQKCNLLNRIGCRINNGQWATVSANQLHCASKSSNMLKRLRRTRIELGVHKTSWDVGERKQQVRLLLLEAPCGNDENSFNNMYISQKQGYLTTSTTKQKEPIRKLVVLRQRNRSQLWGAWGANSKFWLVWRICVCTLFIYVCIFLYWKGSECLWSWDKSRKVCGE